MSIPSNLYYYIEEQRNKFVKKAEEVLYETSTYPETLCLYFDHNKDKNELKNDFEFKGKVLGLLKNKTEGNKRNILILDQSCFYPVSGGQMNDTGKILIDGKEFGVVMVEKVGKCVLHYIDSELEESCIGKELKGFIDKERRIQLMKHHTATHIVFAAARKVLG